MSVCAIEGCSNKHRCKGLCNKHYSALRAHGTPTPHRPTLEERFWAKVNKTDTCWLWTGAKTALGYGNFSTGGGETAGAHRFAFALIVGPIPTGLVLDHLCRVPSCVNPGHLEPVTNRENLMRGTHPKVITSLTLVCQRGHDMRGDGSYVHPRWGRACRECRKSRLATFKATKRGVA